jgi:hypothetical protein
VEQYVGILGQQGPVAMEDDEAGDASSCSVAPLASAGKTSSLRLQEGKSPDRKP